MQHPSSVSNPFAMMLNPEAVVLAMESSEKLNGLQSRICRPLDNPNKKGDDSESSGLPVASSRRIRNH
jgi:hypothetical protein